jgi:hypothetical protein
MRTHQIAVGSIVSAMLAAAAIAGCSGSGGGYSGLPIPHPSPTVAPSSSPSPQPSPILTLGNANIATGGTVAGGFTYTPAANDTIIFTCGCSNQAGITASDATGSFTVTSPAQPTPAAPNPTYTIVPGRNYLIVAEPPASNDGPQGWTMLFAGTVPANDLALGDANSVSAASGTSDVYTTAVALLIYKQSIQNSNTAFDDWNFNAIEGWLQRMVTAPTPQETALLDQIASASFNGKSLFPTRPGWNALQVLNPTINTELKAVIANPGTATPTPCPGGQSGCTGTPTP